MNSTKLRGYLTGLILGDGSIDKGVQKRSFSIKSINKDFIDKIFKDLREATDFDIKIKEVPMQIKNGVTHRIYWELRVKAHPYFKKKYNYFYDDYRKRRITKECLSWLNEEGLANWYMSDGYITLVGKTKGEIKSRRVDICTDRYKKEDVEKIKEYFQETWDIKTSLIKRNDVYRIRISLQDSQKFFLLINPYITDSFKYKLNLSYDYQPTWMCDEYYNLMKEIQKCEYPTENRNKI